MSATITPILGTKTTITFATSGFTANILSVSHSGWNRKAVDTTYFGTTTARTFQPADLYDAGEMTFEIEFPSTTSPVTLMTAAAEDITVKFHNITTVTLVASGFATEFTINTPLEEMVTATVKVKFTGAFTWTNA